MAIQSPKMEVIGVYQLPVTEELVDEQARILYGEDLHGEEWRGALEQTREQLQSTVLVEILVLHPDERFSVRDFGQPVPGESRDNWQVAWAEGFLSADGFAILGRWDPPPALPSEFRVAFYIHYWREDRPLWTSYGELRCPAVLPMPDRLIHAMPYEPVD